MNQISHALHKNWHLIEKDPILSQTFPEKPITAFTQQTNLRDLLVRSHFGGPNLDPPPNPEQPWPVNITNNENPQRFKVDTVPSKKSPTKPTTLAGTRNELHTRAYNQDAPGKQVEHGSVTHHISDEQKEKKKE